MGAVAGYTPGIPFALQMGMHTLELRQNIGVTPKASGSGAAPGVAGGTLACGKGLVLQLAQQIIFFTCVGVMTFKAVHILSGSPHVFALPSRPAIMARQTKLRPVTAQKAGSIATVNRMAAGTFTLCKRGMPVAGGLCEARVTGGAHLLLCIPEQAGLGTGVGGMTCGAFPLTYRCMAVTPLSPVCALCLMTLAAQLRLFLEEQPRMPRDMQAVARVALIVAYRGVLIFAFEGNTVVTLDAVKRQRDAGDSRN
jgi:hypothetical protein